MSPIMDEAFKIDASEVLTIIVNFTDINKTAEVKIQAHPDQHNGKLYYPSIRDYFGGFGSIRIDITQAEKIPDNLFYIVDKCQHMRWE